VMIVGLLMAAASYGLAGICRQLRMDVVRTGNCEMAKVDGVALFEGVEELLESGGWWCVGSGLPPGLKR
jgi:hypothetical protein